jgi:hypothetical protein
MTQADFIWDVTASKHRGNPNSVAANLKAQQFKETNRERIRSQIAACGFAGATLKELKIAKGDRYLYPNELSPRLTELVAMQLIFVSGRKRENCSVYVTEKRWASNKETVNEKAI